MNCKLEKFWNVFMTFGNTLFIGWTVNLKSFEIEFILSLADKVEEMNCKLEKFWNLSRSIVDMKNSIHEL